MVLVNEVLDVILGEKILKEESNRLDEIRASFERIYGLASLEAQRADAYLSMAQARGETLATVLSKLFVISQGISLASDFQKQVEFHIRQSNRYHAENEPILELKTISSDQREIANKNLQEARNNIIQAQKIRLKVFELLSSLVAIYWDYLTPGEQKQFEKWAKDIILIQLEHPRNLPTHNLDLFIAANQYLKAIESFALATFRASGVHNLVLALAEKEKIWKGRVADTRFELIPATWEDYIRCRDSLDTERIRLFFSINYLVIEMGGEGINHASFSDLFITLVNIWIGLKLKRERRFKCKSMGRCTLELPKKYEASPDLVWYFGDDIPEWERGQKRYIDLTQWRRPDLVGEISDTTVLKDDKDKKTAYAKMGIPEYWIINIQKKQVAAFKLTDNKIYEPIACSQVLSDLKISLLQEAFDAFDAGDIDQGDILDWLQERI